MENTTVLLIILSLVTALFIALFQYVYKSKIDGVKKWILTALRTISIFCFLLLLINPSFEQIQLVNEKPILVVALDNSASMRHLGVDSELKSVKSQLEQDRQLNDKFSIAYYKFGSEIQPLDSLDFKDSKTDFSSVLDLYKTVYKEESAPMIMVSDGNQTFGNEASYLSTTLNSPINTVVLGDTTSFDDLSIVRVNHNRYVFHKNAFETELILNYKGIRALETQLKVSNGNRIVYSKNLNFSEAISSKILNIELQANNLGVQNYKVELIPFKNERNTTNNTAEFAIEVIDQKTKVLIVYSTPHPDLGALKKAILSNEQREVDFLTPQEALEQLEKYQLLILYQPDAMFIDVLEKLSSAKLNSLVITGNTTDWSVLHKYQDFYNQELTYQEEDAQPLLNSSYSPFIIEDKVFSDYPPLQTEFGAVSFNQVVDVALFKIINGTTTEYPLLATWESNSQKHGLLLGEGIWRWRAQNYLDSGDFMAFDDFTGKLVQYLSSNKRRRRLVVEYESFYNSTDDIVFNAQFFNKSYELDPTANLNITVAHKETKEETKVPLLFSQTNYKVDLSGLASGDYEFSVANSNESIRQSGEFKVIAFNIEQQFLQPNLAKLNTISDNSGGKLYTYNQIENLITDLKEDSRYHTIQKEIRNVSPLIDWYYLLGFVTLALSLEWFLRKYNGLI